MAYINVGATVLGERPRTKKALKEAFVLNPANVELDQTSPHTQGGDVPSRLRGNEIPEGYTFQVTGPDPYTSRKWYASIRRVGDTVTVT